MLYVSWWLHLLARNRGKSIRFMDTFVAFKVRRRLPVFPGILNTDGLCSVMKLVSSIIKFTAIAFAPALVSMEPKTGALNQGETRKVPPERRYPFKVAKDIFRTSVLVPNSFREDHSLCGHDEITCRGCVLFDLQSITQGAPFMLG